MNTKTLIEDWKSAQYLLENYHIDSLTELIKHLEADRPKYECPKCRGNGDYKISKNIYPSGLPDSGWVFQQGWETKQCDICNGIGYTALKIVPIEKRIGTRIEHCGYCTEDGSKEWLLREKGDTPF